ncbi:L-threonine O-3-phosphate decarboxylase [Selenomonas ruminantium]|uniref:threonine-phosphate decarboxylase n=1 Tax=Selenomonas ruminantium TaxID=971 RepID=A0A1M6SM26_SELRU|nr:threonine-phosphate decarboxylase CobD [Selenomonas ruminantium]SHK45763.1 L-threonine O-3-phosphate decarboxylase [Selenomonas ruminantium]
MEKFEHGGNIYAEAPAGGRWLDFSANINPLGLAPEVAQVIRENIASIIHYPDPEARDLKAALSEHYHLPKEQLLLGNGAAELFYLLLHMTRPRRVGLPVPSFGEYQRAAESVGAEIHFSHLRSVDDFQPEIGTWEKDFENADCIFIGNPNNPTGTLMNRGQLEKYLSLLDARKVWTVVDESFLDFLPDEEAYSVRSLTDRFRHLFVVRSLTKFYAMPGLRLGFASAHPDLVQCLERGKDVWNVNSLAQKAGVAALGLKEYHKNSREFVQREKSWLYEHLRAVRGLEPIEPSVNFIMVDISHTGRTSGELTARMRKQGVLVRDCANYTGLEGQQYIRVAVRSHAENEQMLKVLEAVI